MQVHKVAVMMDYTQLKHYFLLRSRQTPETCLQPRDLAQTHRAAVHIQEVIGLDYAHHLLLHCYYLETANISHCCHHLKDSVWTWAVAVWDWVATYITRLHNYMTLPYSKSDCLPRSVLPTHQKWFSLLLERGLSHHLTLF